MPSLAEQMAAAKKAANPKGNKVRSKRSSAKVDKAKSNAAVAKAQAKVNATARAKREKAEVKRVEALRIKRLREAQSTRR